MAMKYGFTTGSCAAAAAKAAAYMLLIGLRKDEISIETPKGITYNALLSDVKFNEYEASCAVEKDGGDDPDVTNGLMIYATVTYATANNVQDTAAAKYHGYPETKDSLPSADTENGEQRSIRPRVIIDGGEGVGRVTKPGLDQPVGNAAINHVPREMIEKEVLDVCRLADFHGTLKVMISVPGGEDIAKKTFNPRLGIEGGISILGTSGIVEPMSNQAIIDTIKVELNQRRVQGYDYVVVAPGNYGLDFIRNSYGYDLDRAVKCSNFIGITIDMAAELGFTKMLLIGHLGKLIKIAGGIMNTHSREADSRMEILAAFAARENADHDLIRKILDCISTEAAVHVIEKSGKMEPIMEYTAERICYYMEKRAEGKLKADCIFFTKESGEAGKSRGAVQWFTLLEQEQARQI